MRPSSVAIISAACVALVAASSALAASSMTLYSDGAVVEVDLAARNGYSELKLPAGIKDKSLRVTPVGGVSIDRVDIVAEEAKGPVSKKTAALRERRRQLEDRLKALEKKEEIFLSAAKSQSGKAPRKTKTNPEPMTAIRQGTQYAISQLEEVYRGRRLAEDELKKVDDALAASTDGGAKGSAARIWLKEKAGHVRVAYFLPDLRWRPVYDVRLATGASKASLSLRAVLPVVEKDAAVTVALGADTMRINPRQPLPELKNHSVPVTVVGAGAGAGSRGALEFSLTNDTSLALPAGDVSCFVDGSFVGKTSIPATPPGAQVIVKVGP